jgi:hypothetical protein
MKDVYFSPDRKYVVAFYRKKLDFNQKERVRLNNNKLYFDGFLITLGGAYFKVNCMLAK